MKHASKLLVTACGAGMALTLYNAPLYANAAMPGIEEKPVEEKVEKTLDGMERKVEGVGEERADTSDPQGGDLREAWLEGKLEMVFLLNRHLNNFTIDPEVEGSKATLNGSVESEIDRDLAEEVALNVDGVESVDNKLKVDKERRKDGKNEGKRSFAQTIEDSTLTAEVKLKLLANSHTSGLNIDVDTERQVVTLNGEVGSAEEKALAKELAANVQGVTNVVDNLSVVKS